MMIHVIHDMNHIERGTVFSREILRQEGKYRFRFCSPYYDSPVCKGISRAHKQIVHANYDLPEIVIMEDDIHFPAKDGLKYFFDSKPEDFDMYLGGVYSGGIIKEKTISSSGETTGYITKNFSGLHLYIIRKRFYDTFLNIDETHPLDRGMAGKGIFKVCYPFAAIQHNGFSYNTGKEEDYTLYLKGRKIYGRD